MPPASDAINTTEQAPATPPAVSAPAPLRPQLGLRRLQPRTAIPTRGLSKHRCLHRRMNTRLKAQTALHASQLRYFDGQYAMTASSPMFPDRRMPYLKEPCSGLVCCRISTPTPRTDTPFSGKVTQDIMRNGKVVVPVGSELHGRVVYATAGHRLNGGSVIRLRPDEFVLPDGTRYHLHAQVIDTIGSDTNAKGEGNIVANEQGKRTLAELGAGAGGGAIVGAAVGGGVGAVVGTAIGAGVVTAHWLRTNWSANLPAQSTSCSASPIRCF